jgi:hypothetical protein
MKKNTKVFVAVAFLASVLVLPSCKKCVECHYEYEHGTHMHEVEDEACGSENDRNAFMARMQAEAAEKGTTAHCHNH